MVNAVSETKLLESALTRVTSPESVSPQGAGVDTTFQQKKERGGGRHCKHFKLTFFGDTERSSPFTISEEREVLGVGSIPVAILPSWQDMISLLYNCINMNIVG